MHILGKIDTLLEETFMPIAKISRNRSETKLLQNLEKYRPYALKLGADEARVVDAKKIQVEEAVAFKCRVPQCFGYGNCAQARRNTTIAEGLQPGAAFHPQGELRVAQA